MENTPIEILPVRIAFEIPVAPGVRMKRMVYVYAVRRGAVCLIDAGVAGCEVQVAAVLGTAGANLADVGWILLTHSHPDHIGGAAAIQAQSGCRIAIHGAEREWAEDVGLQARVRPVPGFAGFVGGSVRVDRILKDGDCLDGGTGLRLQVLHTPGHSAGAASFFLADNGALFTGDALPQPGGMPVYEDLAASVRSIRRLLSLDGVTSLYSAWDEPRYGAAARDRMQASLEYLQHVHDAVHEVSAKSRVDAAADPLLRCRQVVERLGLPGLAVNPLVARSLAAHDPWCGVRNLAELE